MKHIELLDIELSYFISTGEKVKYNFQEGITFIKGENRTEGQDGQKNGCGKSVIFYDSILFALYGVVSRDGFTMADIPYNKGSKKKCIVRLNLKVHEGVKVQDVCITRTINPSKLTLVVDGIDETQSLSKATQEFINESILNGIKIDVFKQSLAMDIKTTNSFLSMSKVNREKFIGGIFDLSYIKESLKMVRDDYNKLSRDTEVLNGKISSVKGFIVSTESRIQTTEETLNKTFDENKVKLTKLKEAYDAFELGEKPEDIDLQAELDEVDELTKSANLKLKKLEDQKREINNSIRECDRLVTQAKNEIKRDESAKVCPTCKREMDEECRKELATNIDNNEGVIIEQTGIIAGLKEQLPAIEQTIKAISSIFDKITIKKNDINKRYKANELVKTEFNKRSNLLSQLKSQRDTVQTSIDAGVDLSIIDIMSEELVELKETLDTYTNELDANIKHLDVLNHTKTLFGENGIREVILGRIVGLFNKTLNLYLERIETPCRLEFDPSFNYIAKTLGGIEIPIGGLSGGERVRLDTALAFTFKDILRIQNQTTFNVSLYDEWFDVSIDARGLDIISDILTERMDSYGENPLIITHRTDLTVDDSNTVTVIKENGQSRIEF